MISSVITFFGVLVPMPLWAVLLLVVGTVINTYCVVGGGQLVKPVAAWLARKWKAYTARLAVLCVLIVGSCGCASTNPSAMTNSERGAAGIMSHQAEARMNARCPTDGRKPSGWVKCSPATQRSVQRITSNEVQNDK